MEHPQLKNPKQVIDDMKNVFSETRVPGYLTLEQKYFDQEQQIGLEDWLHQLKQITVDYARKNDIDIQPIEDVLNKASFSGDAAGE